MQLEIPLKRLLLITIATGIVFFLVSLFSLTFYLPGYSYNYYIKTLPYTVGIPIRLEIPKINVDAIVEHLGLTPGGAMDVPKGPVDVAWFDLGSRPGSNGSAVIAGHYGQWKSGEGSVFDNLVKLVPGDIIYIQDEKGRTIAFVVRESKTYDKNDSVPDIFSSSDGKAHLNLITCEGDWIATQKTYSNRLVIFADKL